MELELAALATACICMAAILAALVAVILYMERPLPRSLVFADVLFGVSGLVLHVVAQVDEKIDGDFLLAIPFVGLGVGSGIVLLVRMLGHHRPIRGLVVGHAAMLIVGLALVAQGTAEQVQ